MFVFCVLMTRYNQKLSLLFISSYHVYHKVPAFNPTFSWVSFSCRAIDNFHFSVSRLTDCKDRAKRTSSVNFSRVISVLFQPEISGRCSASWLPWEHGAHVWLRSYCFEVRCSVQLVSGSLLRCANSPYKISLLGLVVICCGSVGAAN